MLTILFARVDFSPTEDELREIEESFGAEGCGHRLVIPENFTVTVPPYVEGERVDHNARENGLYTHYV